MRKDEPYNVEEVNLLFRLLEEYDNKYLTCSAYLGIYAGLRRSEISALLFSDIDFENKLISVNKAKVFGMDKDYVKETKSEAGNRQIPISDSLLKVLKQMKRDYAKNKLKGGTEFEDSDVIFSNELGHPFITASITHRWQRFQDFAEKRGLRKLPFHYLRHAYASLLLSSNQTSLRTAQSLMGHSSITMTADVYADSYIENRRMAVEALEDMLRQKNA